MYDVLEPAVSTRDNAVTTVLTGDTPVNSPLFRKPDL